MQYKTKLVLILFLGCLVFSDSLKFNNPNNHGVVGLINIPTARFYEESSSALTFFSGDPDSKITLSMMPYDWFEASVFYTNIEGRPYGSGFSQDYKDKGFNAKFRIKSEGYFPAIALGFHDIGGTGIYSSEYIVGSYGVNNFDFHFGLGWGRLSGGDLQLRNFLADLDKSFLYRNSKTENGGEFRINDYFSGKKVGAFGGVSYVANEAFLLKAEYDSTEIPLNQGFPDRSSNYSFGIEYINFPNLSVALNYERGDYYGVKFSWKSNFKEHKHPSFTNNTKSFKSPYEKLKTLLNENNIGLNSIKKFEQDLIIEVQEYSYKDFYKLRENVNKAIFESDLDVEKVITKYRVAGLKTYSDSDKLVKNEDSYKEIYEKNTKPFLNYSPELVLRPFIAGREGFLKFALLAELNTQYVFNDNLFWTTNLKYALWQNFDELYVPAVNTYPYPVRSDIKDYLNNFKNNIILGRSQIDFYKSFFDDHHIQISAGVFEEMFSGYGIEYLWNKSDSPVALGFEVFEAFKRDYDLQFGLSDYSNVTGHLNLYYENKFMIPFSLHLSYGQYLAGDKGYTFDISRRFRNGVSMGAFITKTNVTSEQFGEGSFDKGVYFTIPLSGNWFSYLWKPLTKDPGSKLNRNISIYDLQRKFKN